MRSDLLRVSQLHFYAMLQPSMERVGTDRHISTATTVAHTVSQSTLLTFYHATSVNICLCKNLDTLELKVHVLLPFHVAMRNVHLIVNKFFALCMYTPLPMLFT